MKRPIILIATLLVPLLAAARPSLAQSPAQSPPEAPPQGAAVQARTMSLGELLAVALRQEPSLARATIDVRIADAAVLEAAGIDDWLLAVSGAWSSALQSTFVPKDEVTGTEAYIYYYTANALNLQANLSRSLPTGGTVGLHAATRRTGAGAAQNPDYEERVTISFAQPLWRGRGEELARGAQARARIERDAAVLAREGAAIDAVQQLIAAYWDLALAWRSLEIRQGSLVLAQEQLRNTRVRIEAGAVAPTEALAVQQTIARREEEILNAELALTERSLSLRRLAGLEVGPGDVDLAVAVSLAVAPRRFDTNALLARAIEQNPSLAALQVQQASLEVAVRLAEDRLAPQLDLDLSLGPEGKGESASEAFGQMFRRDALSFRAGLTYRQALGQREARGRHLSAREQLARHRVSLEETRARLARDLVRAIKRAEIAQKRAEIGQQVIDLATQNIEAEKARFTLGRATNFDVLQRQEELQQAQLTQAQAIVDFLQAVTLIDALTGELLLRYGIALAPAAEVEVVGPAATAADR